MANHSIKYRNKVILWCVADEGEEALGRPFSPLLPRIHNTTNDEDASAPSFDYSSNVFCVECSIRQSSSIAAKVGFPLSGMSSPSSVCD